MNPPKLPITVCLPVRNEEKNLPSCLEALGDGFEEIVVVDSGSTDRTAEIARAAGASVMDFHWDGKFPKKRNWFLANHAFRTSWVLFLDADERVTPAFLEEMAAAIRQPGVAGYWMSFDNWFMGRRLLRGDVFRKLALFRRECGEYERFPEDFWSHLDMEVHEHPVLEGSIGELKCRLEHRDYRGLEHYISKHNQYSSWEANRFLWFRSQGSETLRALYDRQRFKYSFLDRPWFGLLYFLAGYLGKGGFMDGREGLTFALMKFRYFNDIRLKIREKTRGDSGGGSDEKSQ